MESLSRNMRPSNRAPAVPPAEAIMAWPEMLKQQEAAAERTRLEVEIAALQAQAAALQQRIDLPVSSEVATSLSDREMASRDRVIIRLQKLGLQDGESKTVRYKRIVDYEMSGTYIEDNDVMVSKQDDVYVAAHQAQAAKDYTQSGIQHRSYGTKLVLHNASPVALRQDISGVFADMETTNLADTRPTIWGYVEQKVIDYTEHIRADDLISAILPLLPADDLKPVVSINGFVHDDELSVAREVTIDDGHAVNLSATYHVQHGWVGSKMIESNELAYVGLRLQLGDDIKERYSVNARTLEVCPYDTTYEYAGNQHLHDAAEALLALTTAAIDNAVENKDLEG